MSVHYVWGTIWSTLYSLFLRVTILHEVGAIIIPILQMKNWGTERLSNMSKIVISGLKTFNDPIQPRISASNTLQT